MKKLLQIFVFVCLISNSPNIYGAANSTLISPREKYVVKDLNPLQIKFLDNIPEDSLRKFLSTITSIMNKDGIIMKSMIDVYSFCSKHHHKNEACAKEICNWIDLMEPFWNQLKKDEIYNSVAESYDFHYGISDLISEYAVSISDDWKKIMQDGLCLCNIFKSNASEIDVNWKSFVSGCATETPVQLKKHHIDSQIDLRKKAFNIILSDPNQARENGRTGKKSVKKETMKILYACANSGHACFKDLMREWARDHQIENFSENWCVCNILCDSTQSITTFADVAKQVTSPRGSDAGSAAHFVAVKNSIGCHCVIL